jgi:hypothetical protein
VAVTVDAFTLIDIGDNMILLRGTLTDDWGILKSFPDEVIEK